jgi:hypothetical protein
MEKQSKKGEGGKREPHRMRLPGFLIDEEVGLGDVIKRATSFAGIKPCGGCKKRAAALNRWFRFSGKQT